MTRRRLGALVIVTVIAACGSARDKPAPAPVVEDAPADGARIAAWRADLAFLARELPARHVEAFFARSEAAWRADVAALDGALATLDDDAITARLAALVASLGDGHTRLAVPAALQYPLRLMWFDDGLVVLAAPVEQAWAIGGRIVTIGGVAVDDALARMSTVVPHDNDSQLRNEAPAVLLQPTLVRGLDLADAAGTVTIGVALDGAAARPLVLTAGTTPPRWKPMVVQPLARRDPRRAYWQAYLSDSRTLFVQYNACRDETPSFAAFVDELAATIAREPVARIVIDLRSNGGGDSRIFAPFLALMAAHRDVRVFVLIGRATFSSAVLNALQLEAAGATLVGEPAGGAPSHHGEVQSFALPNHPLTVTYSTKFFPDARHSGASLDPAIRVPVTAADYFAGADRALAAAIAAP